MDKTELEGRGIEETELGRTEAESDELRDEDPDELEGEGIEVEIDESIGVLLGLAELCGKEDGTGESDDDCESPDVGICDTADETGNEVITGGNTDDGSNGIVSDNTNEEPEEIGGNVGNAELGIVSVREKTEGDGERVGGMEGVFEPGVTEELPSLDGLGVGCADTIALE